uniref:Uncharacterized protein n=2 Tax=Triticum urartu TaxID=4572 RepID=A0A8R7U4W2_TRIUA
PPPHIKQARTAAAATGGRSSSDGSTSVGCRRPLLLRCPRCLWNFTPQSRRRKELICCTHETCRAEDFSF